MELDPREGRPWSLMALILLGPTLACSPTGPMEDTYPDGGETAAVDASPSPNHDAGAADADVLGQDANTDGGFVDASEQIVLFDQLLVPGLRVSLRVPSPPDQLPPEYLGLGVDLVAEGDVFDSRTSTISLVPGVLHFKPEGRTFQVPLELRIELPGAALSLEQEAEQDLLLWEPEHRRWHQEVADSWDPQTRTLRAHIQHFSYRTIAYVPGQISRTRLEAPLVAGEMSSISLEKKNLDGDTLGCSFCEIDGDQCTSSCRTFNERVEVTPRAARQHRLVIWKQTLPLGIPAQHELWVQDFEVDPIGMRLEETAEWERIASRLAPVVHMAANEVYLPSPIETLLGGDTTTVQVVRSLRELGRATGPEAIGNLLSSTGCINALVKRQGSESLRQWTADASGLTSPSSIRRPTIYWTVDVDTSQAVLTYWMLYPYDPKSPSLSGGAHPYDRESMSVLLDDSSGIWEPRYIIYAGHLAGQHLYHVNWDSSGHVVRGWDTGAVRLAWPNETETQCGHPLAYVALGSHAVYPRAGVYVVDARAWSRRLMAPGEPIVDLLGEVLVGTEPTLGDGRTLCPPGRPDLCSGSLDLVYDLLAFPSAQQRTRPHAARALLFSGDWVDGPLIYDERFPPFLPRYSHPFLWASQSTQAALPCPGADCITRCTAENQPPAPPSLPASTTARVGETTTLSVTVGSDPEAGEVRLVCNAEASNFGSDGYASAFGLGSRVVDLSMTWQVLGTQILQCHTEDRAGAMSAVASMQVDVRSLPPFPASIQGPRLLLASQVGDFTVTVGVDPAGDQVGARCSVLGSYLPSGTYDSGIGPGGREVVVRIGWDAPGSKHLSCESYDEHMESQLEAPQEMEVLVTSSSTPTIAIQDLVTTSTSVAFRLTLTSTIGVLGVELRVWEVGSDGSPPQASDSPVQSGSLSAAASRSVSMFGLQPEQWHALQVVTSTHAGYPTSSAWAWFETGALPTAGFSVTPTTSMTTTEAGGSASAQVRLLSPPTAPVTIPVASSDPGEGLVQPVALVFDAHNWSITQVLTISGVDDALADGDQVFSVTLDAARSMDPAYDGLDPADIAATNIDDDRGALPGWEAHPTHIATVSGPYTPGHGGLSVACTRGIWAVVFPEDGIFSAVDLNMVVSRNRGASWSPSAPIDPQASFDTASENSPVVAMSPTGTWMVGADQGGLVRLLQSHDAGATWSVAPLPGSPTQYFPNWLFDLDTDGAGGWLLAFADQHTNTIRYAVSRDDGATWSTLQDLQLPAPNGGISGSVQVGMSGLAWIIMWATTDSLGGTIGTDADIVFSRSLDQGATWSPTRPITAAARTDNNHEVPIDLDMRGRHAVVTWTRLQASSEAGTHRSVDAGATWGPSLPLPIIPATLAIDSRGHALIVGSQGSGPSFGASLAYVTSTVSSLVWSPPALVPSSTTAFPAHRSPDLATDDGGNYLLVSEEVDGSSVWSPDRLLVFTYVWP